MSSSQSFLLGVFVKKIRLWLKSDKNWEHLSKKIWLLLKSDKTWEHLSKKIYFGWNRTKIGSICQKNLTSVEIGQILGAFVKKTRLRLKSDKNWEHLSKKFDFGWNRTNIGSMPRKFDFGWNWTKISTTLHEELTIFRCCHRWFFMQHSICWSCWQWHAAQPYTKKALLLFHRNNG